MTAIYEWDTVVGMSSNQATSHRVSWINHGLIGNTLVRVAGTVEVKHFYNTPSFPPSMRRPITFGVLFATNTTDPDLLPSYASTGPDWVHYQQVALNAGFGVTSALQSDLVYEGSVYFDTKAQRKYTVDNPAILLTIGTWGDTSSPPDSYEPEFSVSATLHFLTRHDI
jgi:hypothetical protein